MKTIDNLIERIDGFPTLPTIYTSMLEVTSNPRSTVQDLANVVMKDQVSVTKLLKIVNSSLYGIQTRITTVTQAVFFLGFQEVKNIILALSILDIVSKIQKKGNINIVGMWEHSIAVGVITRIIGVELGIKDLENYFIAGLIHDIGKLFFVAEFTKEYGDLQQKAKENNLNIAQCEKVVFGAHHDYVGELIATKWKLPQIFKNAIKYHNVGIVDGKIDQLIACVHLANATATLLELGDPGDNIIKTPNFEVWNTFSFPNGFFRKLYDPIMNAFMQASSILKL